MWFDKWNQSDQYLQVTYQIFSYQICFLTGQIQKIELNFVFWQVKSNRLICICVLTGKIQQTDLNVCFDMNMQKDYFNLCFDKGNQSDQYLHVTYHNFSNQFCFLTGKILKIEFNFVFWQVKSNKFICICVLTGKNPANLFEFLLWHENSNKFIWICVLTKEINLINIYRLHIYHIFSN